MLIDYKIENGMPIIYRTDLPNGPTVIKRGFKPYFYIENHIGEFKGINGERLEKIEVRQPYDVGRVRDTYKKTWESDILYTNRFLIDYFDELPSTKIRPLYLDIECPKLDLTGEKEPIIIIGCEYEGKFVSFNDKDERTLLLNFCKYLDKINPNVITGWNVLRYDMWIILKRMEANNIPGNLLSPLGKPCIAKKRDQRPIPGRWVIDLMWAYQRLASHQLKSKGLDYVSKLEGFKGKIQINWKNSTFDQKIEYNEEDVLLVRKINEKKGIIDFMSNFSSMMGCVPESTYYNKGIIDVTIIRAANRAGLRLPRGGGFNRKADYQGATVIFKEPGMYKNVGVVDVARMYPSIMIKYNMSPETLTKSTKGLTVGNDIYFKPEPQGLVPAILLDLKDKRQVYKDAGEDEKQLIVKKVMNAFYGVFAFPGFRLYSPNISSSITKAGRDLLHDIHLIIEREGYNVLYSHTDSAFISNITRENLDKLVITIENEVKDFGVSTDFYTEILMCGPGRYAGNLEGKLKIVGLESKRAETPVVTANLQEEVIKMILEGKSKSEVAKKIQNIVVNIKKYPLIETAFPSSIKKSISEYQTLQPRVRAAVFSNENLDKKYTSGDRFYLHYVRHPKTDCVAFDTDDDLNGFEINYDPVIEQGVLAKLETIFKTLGWGSPNGTTVKGFDDY